MDRKLVICSGLPYSGKSWLVKRLMGQPGFAEAALVTMDEVRVALYGTRADTHITPTEHVFKNEWLRYEILKRLVLGAPVVLTEAVMLTRNRHQRPMVELASHAAKLVSNIAKEGAARDGTLHQKMSVELHVVLCYASSEAVHKRIGGPQVERAQSHASVFDLKGMHTAYEEFEFPDESTYEPLYLDTSDDSPEADVEKLQEVLDFVFGNRKSATNHIRKTAALESYRLLHEEIRAV